MQSGSKQSPRLLYHGGSQSAASTVPHEPKPPACVAFVARLSAAATPSLPSAFVHHPPATPQSSPSAIMAESTREENVYMAKLAEQAERYDGMSRCRMG